MAPARMDAGRCRSKSVENGVTSDPRVPRRRNQSMTALALPEGVPLVVEDDQVPSKSVDLAVEDRVEMGRLEEAVTLDAVAVEGRGGGGIAPGGSLLAMIVLALVLVGVVPFCGGRVVESALRAFATLALVLGLKGCKLSAFCRRDFRRFVTSSKAFCFATVS